MRAAAIGLVVAVVWSVSGAAQAEDGFGQTPQRLARGTGSQDPSPHLPGGSPIDRPDHVTHLTISPDGRRVAASYFRPATSEEGMKTAIEELYPGARVPAPGESLRVPRPATPAPDG